MFSQALELETFSSQTGVIDLERRAFNYTQVGRHSHSLLQNHDVANYDFFG